MLDAYSAGGDRSNLPDSDPGVESANGLEVRARALVLSRAPIFPLIKQTNSLHIRLLIARSQLSQVHESASPTRLRTTNIHHSQTQPAHACSLKTEPSI